MLTTVCGCDLGRAERMTQGRAGALVEMELRRDRPALRAGQRRVCVGPEAMETRAQPHAGPLKVPKDL